MPSEAPKRAGPLSLSVRFGAVAMIFALSACAPEEKVVRYKPFFAGLEGAEFSGQKPVLNDPKVRPNDPTASKPDEKIVIENKDGTVTLVSRCPKHVMIHLEHFLDADEDDVLVEQVLSDETKEYFRKQGKDPHEYIKELKESRKDIAIFFARIPAAEHTPTVLVDPVGNKTWRIRLTGRPAEGLKYTRLWVKPEGGIWKLVWLD